MPYIEEIARERLKRSNNPRTEGELNYLLTLEYLAIIKELGESYTNYGKIVSATEFLIFDLQLARTVRADSRVKYQVQYSDIETRLRNICHNFYLNNKSKSSEQVCSETIGALRNSSTELYRRKIARYEEAARVRNGDVYDS